jgi:hypothetical protein
MKLAAMAAFTTTCPELRRRLLVAPPVPRTSTQGILSCKPVLARAVSAMPPSGATSVSAALVGPARGRGHRHRKREH